VSFAAILLLAVGLAMDATAVAAARGLAARRIELRNVALVALLFGGFQALMPLIGWLVGSSVGVFVEAWDHWIAFGVLGAIGAKMLWEARGEDPSSARDEQAPFAFGALVVLAIATSIDALAVGVTLPMLGAPLLLSLLTIGVTTAILSGLGLFAGRRFGAWLGHRMDAVGGLILIGIGTTILVRHLAA
jgi:putative Mn2+ efflux pump MntP